MKKELLKKIDEAEQFFVQKSWGLNLNAHNEMLFALIRLLDIREDEIVSEDSFAQMVSKFGVEMMMDETFQEEYMVAIGLFIESLMETFFANATNQEGLSELLVELGEIFANALSEKEIALLVDEMIEKMMMLSESEKVMSEEKISSVVGMFIEPNYKAELLSYPKQQIVDMLLGIVMSMVSFLALIKMEQMALSEMEGEDDLSLEEQIRLGFRKTPLDEPLYNPENLSYALGSKPICNLCDKEYAPRGLKRHLNSCIKNHYTQKEEELYYLVIKSDMTEFYLHIAMKPYARLADLDGYLRDVWLECCGHMSEFSIGRHELEMTMSIDEIFFRSAKIEYIYDFGSSTHLTIESVNIFKGEQSTLIETLARNPLPKIKCSSCGSSQIVAVCAECLYEGEGNLCKKCLPKHECGLDMALPYVNSPRYGECGYGDWDNVHGFSEEEFEAIEEQVCEAVED